MNRTSAVSATSPDICFQANWKASTAPQMFAPPPVTRYSPVEALNSTLPFAGVSPTSPEESKTFAVWAARGKKTRQTAHRSRIVVWPSSLLGLRNATAQLVEKVQQHYDLVILLGRS